MGEWREQAACRDMPKSMFVRESMTRAAQQEAKAVCAGCPVMNECREMALELADSGRVIDVPIGVWGGTNEAERRAMLSRRRRAKPAPLSADFVPGTRCRHGSHNAYRQYECRCPVCVEGQQARWRGSYDRQRDKKLEAQRRRDRAKRAGEAA